MEASDLSMEPGGLGSPGLPMEVGGPRSSGSASERLPPWNARATAWLEQIGEGIEEVRLQHADLHLLILSLRRRVAQSLGRLLILIDEAGHLAGSAAAAGRAAGPAGSAGLASAGSDLKRARNI